jgi:hypothetical protein
MTNASKWIWYRENAQPDEYADFKGTFTYSGGEVFLEISADSNYCAYINGTLAAFGQYPDFPYRKFYDRVDVTEFVKDGENELLVTAWHFGASFATHCVKDAAIRFEVLADDKALLVSDENILARANPNYVPHICDKVTVQLGFSYYYDATKDFDAPYGSAVLAKGEEEMHIRPIKKLDLCPRMDAEIVMSGHYYLGPNGINGRRPADFMQYAAMTNDFEAGLRRSANKLEEGFDGVYFITDVGEETTGFLDFDIEVDSDCELYFAWGEHLADGRCRTTMRNFTCRFRAKAGRNVYMNPFLRNGCRYVEVFVHGSGAKLNYMGIRPTPYPQNEVPFSTGSVLRDKIYKVCVNTLRHSMHEHYEDCPWREQALYALDSRNEMLCGYYAFDDKTFPRSSLDTMSYGIRPDGLLNLFHPSLENITIPSFSVALFLSMREYMDHSGDVEFIKEKYPRLKSIMQVFFDNMDEKGLCHNFFGEGKGYWNFYEWSDGLGGEMRTLKDGVEAPLNAFLSLALMNLSAMAEKLGELEDAKYYAERSKALNEAVFAYFYDTEKKLFVTRHEGDHRYHVLTNAMCMLCGAADGTDKSAIIDVLLTNGNENVVPNTLSMNSYRFDALLNESECYGDAILREIDEVYLSMLCQGATTFFETIDGEKAFAGAGSLCHGWSALPVYYYHKLLK